MSHESHSRLDLPPFRIERVDLPTYRSLAERRYSAMNNFHGWLVARVKVGDLSMRDIGLITGMDHSTVSRLYAGQRTPTLETALRLVNGLVSDDSSVGKTGG